MGAASRSTMLSPCRATTTTTTRYVRALLIGSIVFGCEIPLACADGPPPSTKEADGAAAATPGSASPHFAFAQLAHEMSQAARGEQGEPVAKFGAAAESGLSGTGDREIGHEGGTASAASAAAAAAAAGGAVVSFSSSNDDYPAVTWSPWTHLAEPYRETVLRAESTAGDPDNDVFVWTMPGENGASYEGREIRYTFTEVGIKELKLSQTVTSTGERYQLDSSVVVKYVRREIRDLTETDREAFFDTMETLYRLPTAEGVHQYGSEYKGIEFFVQMHLDGAGMKDCDHWHDDAGIMTHHVGYTLQFEQAMQLVNPSVSIPYWEYTMEPAMGLESYGQSELFARDWFGVFSPDNAMHTVTEGRWAYLPVMEDARDYVHNPYGLLRSPWNLDSTPYVTRHNTTSGQTPTAMVSCEVYSSCFESSSLKVMNACLNGETHGPVHILIGGEWGGSEEAFVSKVGYAESVPLVTKYLWRKGYLRIPESCTTEEDGCITTCPSHLYEAKGMTPYDVLMDVHAQMWLIHSAGGTLVYDAEIDRFVIKGHENDPEFEDAFWSKMLASMCNPGHVGEMFTSAAPYDPLFWVVHPTADRLLGWRRMLGRQGVDGYDFDETWGYRHAAVVGETGTVCNWEHVRAGTNDMPTCQLEICGGHNEQDLLPFKVKINGESGQYTNAQWMDLIYPTNVDLPYMYDSYGWEHCSPEGYSFGP